MLRATQLLKIHFSCSVRSTKYRKQYVVTTDKDGPDCEFARHLPTCEVAISQPFWPGAPFHFLATLVSRFASLLNP